MSLASRQLHSRVADQAYLVPKGTRDVHWYDGKAASLTTVTVSGSQTITERDGRLSVVYSGQSDQDLNCVLAPVALATGEAVSVEISSGNPEGATYTRGVVITDGTTSAANAVFYGWDNFGTMRLLHREGTLTAMGTSDFQTSVSLGLLPVTHLRAEYEAADTFRLWISPDGISWMQHGSDATFTMTPSHIGVAWSAFGSASSGVANFSPLRVATV